MILEACLFYVIEKKISRLKCVIFNAYVKPKRQSKNQESQLMI